MAIHCAKWACAYIADSWAYVACTEAVPSISLFLIVHAWPLPVFLGGLPFWGRFASPGSEARCDFRSPSLRKGLRPEAKRGILIGPCHVVLPWGGERGVRTF